MKPDARLINAAVKVLDAETRLKGANQSFNFLAKDIVEEECGKVIDNGYHGRSVKPIWQAGAFTGIEVIDYYYDDRGPTTEKRRVIDMEWSF